MAKTIMIQGTMSNAGKSLLVAGLCRIFMQDGYRAVPFKAQNMALNSYITEDGLEMGRAQVMQAEAAGIKPVVQMNPILLKPVTDMGSQVIVEGVSVGTMPAKEYFSYKKTLIPVVRKAYETLAREYDIVVIEGAGSPAEINLKQDDIVNMGMARMADAPVLLVGDIDCGGVFAQLYGTVKLLPDEERQRIKGLVINKFRGDVSILEPGIRQIEELCQIPVAGVVPFMDIDLEDEDSLSERLKQKTLKGEIEIAVICFPKISNFTDFSVFSCIPGVNVRYVRQVKELGTPDLLILPGTKNTISDLLWMRKNGLEQAVVSLAEQGTALWGICGGYQMMGEILEDPCGVEGEAERHISGMGLFPVKTVFSREKTRNQVEGAFSHLEGIFEELSGKSFSGYEIHMGETWIDRENGPADTARFFRGKLEICRPLSYLLPLNHSSKKMCEDGWGRGNLYGCYTHGIFDQTEIVKTIINALRKQKGLPPLNLEEFDYSGYRQKQYDHLAEVLRGHLDMKEIYHILEEKNREEEGKEKQKKEEQKVEIIADLSPAEIEARSFAQIELELKEKGLSLIPGTEEIVKRAIHTTADFDYAVNLRFSPEAVKRTLLACRRGATIVTDTQMACSGINKAKAKAHNIRIHCFMSDEDVAQEAKERGCTRAAVSMEKAARLFGAGNKEAAGYSDTGSDFGGGQECPVIFAIGNAPTALIRLNSLMDEGKIRPALVVGAPVGFVNVVAAKELLQKREDVPCIVAAGRKGGSNVAAAIINALINLLP